MFALRVSAASRRGAKRPENQDRWLADGRRAAVADGMGGHCAGAVAAQIAVDTLRELGPSTERDDLAHGCRLADHAIREDARRNPSRTGMGTTLVALEFIDRCSGPCVAVVAVGDSRLYRLRKGLLWQITRDHSWAADMIVAGFDPAAAQRYRNVLTRALGSEEAPNVDSWELDVEPGDQFLLCSDGTWGALADEELTALWQRAGVDRAAEQIVAAAVAAGSRDDATAVAVAVSAA